MDNQTWAIVGATVSGPVAAVAITLWHQWRSSRRERRLFLIRTLVAMRFLKGNADYGMAISLIPIEFKDEAAVLNARKALMEKVDDGLNETDAKLAEIENLISDLIGEMLKSIGFKLTHSDVRSMTYTPNLVGWRDETALRAQIAQQCMANAFAKSAYFSQKIAEKAGAVNEGEQALLPFPEIERPKS